MTSPPHREGSGSNALKALLFCSPEYDLSSIAGALAAEGIERRDAHSLLDVGWVGDSPAVLILDEVLARTSRDISSEATVLQPSLIIVTTPETTDSVVLDDRVVLTLHAGGSATSMLRVLRSAYQVSATRLNTDRAERELERTRN